MHRAAGSQSDYAGGVNPDADPDVDTASEVSDGESLSSEGEYEKDVVSRVYRPITVSDHSAYDIQLPASKQRQARPDSSRAGKQPSRVVDYAAYTKNEAKAEVQQATGESASSPAKRETVRNKDLFTEAFGKKKATAIPDIDFTRPTSIVDAESAHLHYDPTAYGGSVYHEFAGNVHLQSVTQGRRPGSAADRSRPSTGSGSRNKTGGDSVGGTASRPATSSGSGDGGSRRRATAAAAPSAAAVEEDEATRKRRVEADAARRREEREQGEIERLRAEAAAVEDADRREYLEMKLLLREEALGELRRANADAAAAAGDSTALEASAAAAKLKKEEAEKQATAAAGPAKTEAELAHDRHVQRVSRAMAARRAGESYDETLLHDVPEFDLAAAGALYAATRDEVRVDTEAVEEARHRQFYDAVLSLEEVVASPGLARVTSKCLERHRQLFQRTKVARERGEFTHEEHAAFKEFADKVQEFIFSRVAEAVGVSREEFDVEDFFSRVFEEDDNDDDGDDAGTTSNDYPLLSNETWEVLLSMLNFESFIDLMDHYIFTRNNATTQGTTSTSNRAATAAAAAAASSAATSATASRAAAAAADAAASVPGVDSFVEEGRPVRRVGSADGSTAAMSRQSSSAVVGDEARVSPPPPQRRDILAAPKSPVPPTSKTPLRPAGLAASSSAGSYGVATSAIGGGGSLNARRHGALPPVGVAGAVKTKGVPLVPNASLGSKRPAGTGPKPKSAFQ